MIDDLGAQNRQLSIQVQNYEATTKQAVTTAARVENMIQSLRKQD